MREFTISNTTYINNASNKPVTTKDKDKNKVNSILEKLDGKAGFTIADVVILGNMQKKERATTLNLDANQYEVRVDSKNGIVNILKNSAPWLRKNINNTITNTNTTPTNRNSKIENENGLFSNKNITTEPAFTYTIKTEDIKARDPIVSLSTKFNVDTYQIIAANPQLKEGIDYKVTYPKPKRMAVMESTLRPGQKITIPARYKVKPGSCKSIDDVAKITGVPKSYIEGVLMPAEMDISKIKRKEHLTTYRDNAGTPTIGYGHVGRVDGIPLSMKNKITISEKRALEILAEDILKHEAMSVAYFGKENWEKTPKSIRIAILDNTYNKGIWNGYLAPIKACQSQQKIKKNLQDGHYLSALCNTRRYNTYAGIKKRCVYRFITGMADLDPTQRKKAMKAFKPYYLETLKELSGATKTNLKKAWENAEKNGKTSGFTM